VGEGDGEAGAGVYVATAGNPFSGAEIVIDAARHLKYQIASWNGRFPDPSRACGEASCRGTEGNGRFLQPNTKRQLAMASPYIPARDSLFSSWLLNFATLIAASPTDYGLIAGDATAITAQNTAFQAAYLLATDPGTRTSVTVAAKDTARSNAEGVVRPYAMRIRNNTTVSDGLKVGLGLTIPSTTPTPVPPPIVAPELGILSAIVGTTRLTYKEPGAAGKAKPYGSIGVEYSRAIGTVPAVDPAQGSIWGTATKSPFQMAHDPADAGKVCTLFGRFVTRSGPGGIAQSGPWSAPLTFNLM
jgi:hypothetical protein